eukprot:EG_transcript_13062
MDNPLEFLWSGRRRDSTPPAAAAATGSPTADPVLQLVCDGCDVDFLSTNSTPNLLACGHTLCNRCLKCRVAEGTAVVRCPSPPRGCAAESPASAICVNYAILDLACPMVLTNPGQPEGGVQDLVLELVVEVPIACSICFEDYSEEERVPFALPCGHTFCQCCLARLREDDRFRCPNRCPLPDDVEVDNPELVLLPVPNVALLRAIHKLRGLPGGRPTSPGTEPARQAAERRAAPQEGPAGDAGGQVSARPSARRARWWAWGRRRGRWGSRRCWPGPLRTFAVGMLLFTVVEASAAVYVAYFQGHDCSRTRVWLVGLAALSAAAALARPLAQWFISDTFADVISVLFKVFFYSWAGVYIINIIYGRLTGEPCELLSTTWLLGVALLCLHVVFGVLECCVGGRAYCFDRDHWTAHVPPFMDVGMDGPLTGRR